MNLINFHVKEIIQEIEGRIWNLLNMTEEELENEKSDTDWYDYLISDGIKQTYKYCDDGGDNIDTKIFNITKGQKPYHIGYVGLH